MSWSSPTRTMKGPSATRVLSRIVAPLLVVVVGTTALVATQPAAPAAALSGSEFNPEYIISDDLFYDGAAMTAAQIQTFLDGKIGTCQNDRCLNVAVLPVTSQAATYSPSTGGMFCSAITGGNLRVSELIYRTQAACGISAKVILVTLQKEQGLVTHKSPSDRALRAAMGMGCPDTAPCSDAFAGLANQIISGTRQLNVYKVARFARQPGLNWIGYHPNADCGGTTLNIRNYATAALYNYTPYQPNSAALANLGTVGDSCSSYGNRNFWTFYNNWFGPTTEIPCTVNPTRDITRYWEQQGGPGGAYGVAVSPGIVAGPGGTTIGSFTSGDIYCTPRVGAIGVLGDIRSRYDALGGPFGALGSPINSRVTYAAGGVSGHLQEFQRGTMLSSAATGSYAVLHGPVREAWGSRGGSGGSLGWPTGNQESVSAGLRQQFQHGLLMVPAGKPAFVVAGEIGAYWATGSNTTILGSPTGAATEYTAGGVTGQLQYFDFGLVMSSTQTGTHAVLNGAMRNTWGAAGGSGGSLGWPTGDQESAANGYRQDFQHGTLFASGSGVGAAMPAAIADYWSAGSNAARLGYPTASSTTWTAGGVTGTLQYFELGMVLSSATTGTYAVLNGRIRDAWGAAGGSGGTNGWPTGDQQVVSGELRQQFQRGVITVPTGSTGDISVYLATGSNAARLGSSMGAPTTWTAGGVTGQLQYFTRGMVLSSAATGTYAVLNGAVRDAWGASGGTGGSIGWPTADQQSVAGGARQQFQRGVIVAPTGGVGAALSGEFATYWATGSNASKLGSPTGSPAAWTAGGVTGELQYFQRGMVLSSSTTGTFAVLSGGVRDSWGSQGGSGGALGWPTGDQQVVGSEVRQQFQRGIVMVPVSGGGSLLSGDFATYWGTGSNGARLGSPTGSPAAWTAGGVTGQLQYFERGMVLSSAATGTFAVLAGPLRDAWGTLGGSGGSLGWPTGDQEIAGSSVRQHFQKGTLTITAEGVAISLTAEYYEYWSSGSNQARLGQPIAARVPWTAGGVTGSYQVFRMGMVLSSPTTGTFAVLDGKFRDTWGAAGGSGGSLGWPTGDQQAVPEGARQQFQHGAIVVPTSGAPYVTTG